VIHEELIEKNELNIVAITEEVNHNLAEKVGVLEEKIN
jgi:hypothetical protein